MKVVIKQALAYGVRREVGEVVDMPDEVIKAYGPEYVEKYSETPEDTSDESESEAALGDMTKAELQGEAAKRDLDTSGTKADLIERIELFDAEE